MAMAYGPLEVISSVEKVRSWMASTSEVPQYDPRDEPDNESVLFELTHHPIFGEDRVATPHQKVFIPKQKEQDDVSCASVIRKYLPAHASDGSQLLPGFLKTVRRRQSIALLRKHAFRWATISSKKFVMIRTDGCNMVPWTDVNEYFFPLCDDPSCEIVLLALKYAMGYPKMIRHIHPCSQREQLRFGDLFKVVSFGAILVDIDAVLANKGVLWNLVEEMHASCNPGLMSSKCSYRCPEKKAYPMRASGSTPTTNLSQHARANTPWDGVMDFQQDDHSVYIEEPTTASVKVNTQQDFTSCDTNIVKFLGEQASQMWNTLSEGTVAGARPTKSWNDVSPSKDPSQTTELCDMRQAESSSNSFQIRNQRSFSATDKRSIDELACQDKALGPSTCTATESAPQTTGRQTPLESGPVVGLRVNQNRLLPMILPGEGMTKKTQDISKWLVPVYLAQNICLNAHVTGKLIGVYRDFIVGRTCKTPGGRGYARLCTRQEGRDLTRWLFYMSEKASIIPNWTIVTSRCLLMQWKDFLSYLPTDMIQGFELDLSLSVMKMGQQNNHGPIDAKDDVSNTDTTGRKAVGQPCLMIKKYDKAKVHDHARGISHTCAKPDCPLPIDNCAAISKVEGYQIVPESWCPSADWSTPLLGEHDLPFPQLQDIEEPPWNAGGFPTTEIRSPREDFLIGKCKCDEKKQKTQAHKVGASISIQTKLPCIVGTSCQFQEDKSPEAGVRGHDIRGHDVREHFQDIPSPKHGINVRKSSPGTLRRGKPGPRQKPKQPMKGRKYICKPKLHPDDDLVIDGQCTGQYQTSLDQSKPLSGTKLQSKPIVQKQKRKYTRRLKASSLEKQHHAKVNQINEPATTDHTVDKTVDPEDQRRKALENIPKELINNQSYEKYVHRRNQAEDTKSEHNTNKGGASNIETILRQSNQPSCSTTFGWFSSSKEAKTVLQGSDIKSKASPGTLKVPKDEPKVPGETSLGSNPKVSQKNNAKLALRPKSPSLDDCKLEICESDVPHRKNHFQGLSLWEEEDEISEMNSFFRPSKATSLPLKHCLKKNGKKPPTKTVSWHIPGVYPREDAVESGVSDEKARIDTEKPVAKPSEKNEKSPTITAVKKEASKVIDNIPLKPEPGGDFKPRTKKIGTANTKTTNESKEDLFKAKKAGDDEIKSETVQINQTDSSAGADGLSAEKVATPEPQPSTSCQNTKGVVNLNEQSETPSSSRLAGKVAVKTCLKTDQHILSPTNKVESLARIYTGSNVQQQELIAKRLSLGRKAVKSEPKIPSGRTKSSIKTHLKEKVDGTGSSTSEHASAKGKRLARKPKRKREGPKPKSELETTDASSAVSTFTAWEVKNEPGVSIELGHHKDQKLLHTDLHGELTLRVPVDRTELIKTSSIVQQQQKLLEAIKKKTPAKPKENETSCCQFKTGLGARCDLKGKREPSEISAPASGNQNPPSSDFPRSASVTCYSSSDNLKPKGSKVSTNSDHKVHYSFQPHFDPGQTVSNRGLALYEDLVLPYVAMNGYKYVTLVDATRVFPLCRPNCRVSRALLRSHRSLHRTMCSWEQVYGFELTQPNKKPPVRTGDMLLRFDTLMLRLPLLELEIKVKHQTSRSKGSQNCGYPPPS